MVGIIKNGSFWLRFPTQILYQNATEELRNVCGRSTWHIRHMYGPRCDRRWVPGVTKAQRDSERSKETGKRETNDKRTTKKRTTSQNLQFKVVFQLFPTFRWMDGGNVACKVSITPNALHT